MLPTLFRQQFHKATTKKAVLGMATIGTLERISARKLRDLLLGKAEEETPAAGGGVAVIDVRDDDYIGGHIKGARNFPSQTLDATLPTLVRQLQDEPIVVFHCALSQQRGPGAALRYLRERERVLAREKKKAASKKSADGAATSAVDGAGADAEAEVEAGLVAQKVFVLDRGFVGWQELYGEDETLTEGYRRELWKDGYWG